ncbi:hypothetical protein LTR56_025938 [Elasticomyces elasticus]|nr:hypothetical protein LTR56_025938 [Elasticomyces elasticus]KAK5737972.1 hypothetical protein LTS12_025730 [Elasticomyces elasticus]
MSGPVDVLKQGLGERYKSGDFSDFEITCGHHTFEVHKPIEGQTGKIELKAIGESDDDATCDDPEAIKLMIDFFYHLDYNAEPLELTPMLDMPETLLSLTQQHGSLSTSQRHWLDLSWLSKGVSGTKGKNTIIAQKAQRTQATRNSPTLNRTQLISLGIHLFFLLVRTILFSRRLLPFALLNFPASAIEFWFEQICRTSYTETANGKELQRAVEALDAEGLTEWMWDVVYWSWGNTVLAALLGSWLWWLYAVVLLYSAWLAFLTYSWRAVRLQRDEC